MLTGAILIRCLFVDGENKAMTGACLTIIINQGSGDQGSGDQGSGVGCSEATFTPNHAESLRGAFPPELNASDTAINIPNLSDTVDSNPRPPDYSEDLFTQLVTSS